MSSNPRGAKAAAKKPPKRFAFIDNSNPSSSNSTQVRRHVMQEHMREKRWQSRSVAETIILRDNTANTSAYQSWQAAPQSAGASTGLGPTQIVTPTPSPENISILKPSPTLHDTAFDYSLPGPSRTHSATSESPIPYRPLSSSSDSRALTSSSILKLNADTFSRWANAITYDTPPTPVSASSSRESLTPELVARKSWSLAHVPDPKSVLSAARTDPFDSLPMTLSKADQELFDFYANVMPAISYGFGKRKHNWYLTVFIPEAKKGSVTLENTVLVHAANTMDWVKGQHESPLAVEHRARASSMLSKHYREHPNDTSDATITATMSAAALEDFDPRPERRPIAWMHWKAALSKIRQRGGPAVLDVCPTLRMLINWQDYIFSGYDGMGYTFHFTPEYANLSEVQDPELIGRQELAQQCEEFLVFLKCTEQLALVTKSQKAIARSRQRSFLRFTAFEPKHPLLELISNTNALRYTKTGQLKQIISRLATLMTLNVAIWEYRYDTDSSENFLRELCDNIYVNELHNNHSVEALLQILLSGSDMPGLQHSERPWLVSRLLKVAKRLGPSSWNNLNSFLLSCLTLEVDSDSYVQGWEEFLRNEILSAPLVSYTLPFLGAG